MLSVGGTPAHTHAIAVDWAEIEFETTQATNIGAVREVLRRAWNLPPEAKPYVEPQDAAGNAAATVFRFRIHDPDQFHAISKTLAGLNRRFSFIGTPRLTAIEIAHDTRCRGATVRELAEIAADRYRFCAHIPEHMWHFYRRRGEQPQALNEHMGRGEVVQYFEDGWQLTDTNDKDGSYIRRHMYVKVSNNSGEDKLTSSRWSARDEITLRGQALPCQTVEELSTLNFSALAKYFTYRCYAESKSQLMTLIRDWRLQNGGEQIGRRGEYPRKQRAGAIGLYRKTDPTQFRSGTNADPLNRTILRTLRTLTTHWSSKRRLSPRLNTAGIAPCTESGASNDATTGTRESLTATGAAGIETLTPATASDTALTIALPQPPPAATSGTPCQAQEGAARLPPQGGAAPSDGTPHDRDNIESGSRIPLPETPRHEDESWQVEIAALTMPPAVSTEDTPDL